MELKSEPAYTTVNVTDFDIAFPGDLQTYTLREGVDKYERDGDLLQFTFGTTGKMQFHLQHAHYVAIRERVIRVLAPVGPQPQSADPQLPTQKQTEQ